MIFSRRPEAPVVHGALVRSAADLERLFAPYLERLVIADISLGAWRGNHVAMECCEQMGIAAPPMMSSPMSFRMGEQGALVYADSVGKLVDAETRGDVPVLFALNVAQRIAIEVRRSAKEWLFVVIAPQFGLPWENENELLIRFLAQALQQEGSQLLVVSFDDSTVISASAFVLEWAAWGAGQDQTSGGKASCAVLFPGLISEENLRRLGVQGDARLLPLSNGRQLTLPWARPNPAQYSRLAFDGLASQFAGVGWVESFAQCYGNTMFANCGLLCEQAQDRFGEGGYGVAFRLLERAVACAGSAAQKTLALAAKQGMRIAIHRFAEAASAPDAPAGAPPELAKFLRQSKGWGLVMSGRAAESVSHFQAALEPGSGTGSGRERLYLRNISALSAARLGDIEAALETELDIERELAALPEPDWHLIYINSLNLARLYRRRREFEQARTCYQRAFATMDGAWSESDGLYVNLTFAQLETEAGAPDIAREHWLRAGLHWVSCEAPEALAWRVASAALGRSVKPGQMVEEEVSAYLEARLCQAFGIRGQGDPAVFVKSVTEQAVRAAAGAVGWSVLLSDERHQAPSSGQANAQLRRMLKTILMELAGGELGAAQTLVVPDRHGREMPSTRQELTALCMEFGVGCMTYEGEACAVEGALRVGRGPLVASITPFGEPFALEVRFKRYLAPERLDGSAARLVAMASDGLDFDELVQRGYSNGLIRSLEQRRIVQVNLAS